MSLLRWSQQACIELRSIHSHVSKDSPVSATTVVRQILERAEQIPGMPLAARVVPELGDASIREVSIHSWRLIYRVQNEHVVVLALVHKRRISLF